MAPGSFWTSAASATARKPELELQHVYTFSETPVSRRETWARSMAFSTGSRLVHLHTQEAMVHRGGATLEPSTWTCMPTTLGRFTQSHDDAGSMLWCARVWTNLQSASERSRKTLQSKPQSGS